MIRGIVRRGEMQSRDGEIFFLCLRRGFHAFCPVDSLLRDPLCNVKRLARGGGKDSPARKRVDTLALELAGLEAPLAEEGRQTFWW